MTRSASRQTIWSGPIERFGIAPLSALARHGDYRGDQFQKSRWFSTIINRFLILGSRVQVAQGAPNIYQQSLASEGIFLLVFACSVVPVVVFCDVRDHLVTIE